MKTVSYINADEELIEVGSEYLFGQLWDSSGDGDELLESGCIAVMDENNDYENGIINEVVVDFEIVKMDDNIMDTVVKVTHIS